MECVKCQGKTVEGVLTLAHGGVSWITKEEHNSFLSKLTTPLGGNVKAFKCENCGNLELIVK